MAYEKHTWSCGETVTADLLNHMEDGIEGADPGYSCEATRTIIFDGSLSAYGSPAQTSISLTSTPTGDSIVVTIDGNEYLIPKNTEQPPALKVYGDMSGGKPVFSNYPCCLMATFGTIYFENAGTYSVVIDDVTDGVVVTDCFQRAVESIPGVTSNLLDGKAEGSIRSINSTKEGEDYSLGQDAFSVGTNSKASGWASFASGTDTEASGRESHAEGLSTRASGDFSHADGNGTTASGMESHAEGSFTIANHKSQHVFGEYNAEDTSYTSANQRGNYVEIVGNGTRDDTRSNARTLDWQGNEKLAGGLTLGLGTADEVTISATQLKALLATLS